MQIPRSPRRRPRMSPRRQPILAPCDPGFESLEDRTLLSVAAGDAAAVVSNYGKIPLSFEPNQGQTDAGVQFLAHGAGYSLFLTPDAAVFDLKRPDGTATVLHMGLVGANTTAPPVGEDLLPGKSNYFLGNDPAQWRTNIANFGQVAYRGVYPGVDLVYHGSQGQLEYDFQVAPGADPGRVVLDFSDATSLDLDAQGNLVLHTPAGDVVQDAPVIYQDIAGVRQFVPGSYVLQGGHHVGIQLGVYDPTQPLVIDPVFVYSTYLGGLSTDEGDGIAVDPAGNAYISGTTESMDLPGNPEIVGSLTVGVQDAFVIKLNPAGTAVIYSTFIGGSENLTDLSNVGNTLGGGIAVDAAGDAYITGYTESRDFFLKDALSSNGQLGGQPDGSGEFPVGGDAFVLMLDPSGSVPQFSTYLGGIDLDNGNSIAVDLSGNVYVTGSTRSKTGFPMPNGYQKTYGGEQNPEFYGFAGDAFAARLQFTPATGKGVPSSLKLIYSTYLGGSGDEDGYGIAVDAAGDAYITGFTSSYLDPTRADAKNFPTVHAYQPLKSGLDYSLDAFVTELNPSGQLVYSSYYGGSDEEIGLAIAVDRDGHAYFAGLTDSKDLPSAGGTLPQSNLRGSEDAFVAEVAPGGSSWVYSTYLGGSGTGPYSGNDIANGIAVDPSGDAYITGGTSSTDFTGVRGDAPQPTYGGGANPGLAVQDGFVAKLHFQADTSTLSVAYATYLGGSGGDYATAIAVDPYGSVYVTGQTFSDDFPLAPVDFQQGPLSAQPAPRGGGDAFVTKISGIGAVVQSIGFGRVTSPQGKVVDFTAGVPFGGPVATFTFSDPTYEPDDFTASIDWGDGSGATLATSITRADGSGQTFQVVGTHTYMDAGAYPLVVDLLDKRDGVEFSAVNLSHQAVNQSGGSIAIDPSTPGRLFAVSATDQVYPARALFAAASTDGGLTWTPSTIAGETAGLPTAVGSSPKAAFDRFGNLYLAYVGGEAVGLDRYDTAVVALSTDGGRTFTQVMSYTDPVGVDQPSIATGPAASGAGETLWFTGTHGLSSSTFVLTAAVSGLGATSIAHQEDSLPDSEGSVFSDVAVSSAGKALVVYEKLGPDPANTVPGSASIVVELSREGQAGDLFGTPTFVASTKFFNRTLPASPFRPLESDPKLAWDRTTDGPHKGRVYVVYADVSPTDVNSTNIEITFSDDEGKTWSKPAAVADFAGPHDEFLPAITVDSLSGEVAVTWYDTRDDSAKTAARSFVAVSSDGGSSFKGVSRIGLGASSPDNKPLSEVGQVEYGDSSGVAFLGGKLYPVFADNGDRLGGNPSRPQFDLAAGLIGVVTVAPAPVTVIGQQITATEGTGVLGLVASFNDPDPAAMPGNYTATIDWGDGSSPETVNSIIRPVGPLTPFEVGGSHTYEHAGAYPITVVVHNNVTKVDDIAAVDTMPSAGNQLQGTIAVDPSNPNHLFAASANGSTANPSSPIIGLSASYSVDGGATWKSSNPNGGTLANGSDRVDGSDQLLPTAGSFPNATFDAFGNLFLSYKDTASNAIVLVSINGGMTFNRILVNAPASNALAAPPRVVAGPGAVWLIYEVGRHDEVMGAMVTGLDRFGDFDHTSVPVPQIADYAVARGSIAVGPGGEVLVAYQNRNSGAGPDDLYVSRDPDGLGPAGFSNPILVARTQIGADRSIPAEATENIDAEPSLAWDLSTGLHRGRVYLAYTDTNNPGSGDTTIRLRYSDDGGMTWQPSASVDPIPVDSSAIGYDFNPSIAVDPATGDLGVIWYSTQDIDPKVNVYTATSSDGGLTFSHDRVITTMPTDATDPNLTPTGMRAQLGRQTQVVFLNGLLHPGWTDNSPALKANPDRPQFDFAAAAIGVAHVVDAPITVTAKTLSVTRGSDLLAHFKGVVATIDDDNVFGMAGDFTVSVDWGDGTLSTSGEDVVIQPNGQGKFDIVARHDYAEKKTFTVKTTVLDRAGSLAEASSTAKVSGSLDVSSMVQVSALGTVFNYTTLRWEGSITVTNVSPITIPGPIFEVVITGLPDGFHLVNATGMTDGGDPFIGYDLASLASGESLPLVLPVFDGPVQKDFSYGIQVISDPPPWPDATGVSNTASVGTLLNAVVAVFTAADAGDAAGDYTATIDWGDSGAPTLGVIAADPGEAGEFDVLGTHAYPRDGTFATTITIMRSDETQATARGSATVAVPAPVVTGLSIAETEGIAFQGVVATFTTAVADSSGDFTATVDWGDGTPPSIGTVSGTSTSFGITGSHTYAAPGTFPINVLVADPQGRLTAINSTAATAVTAAAAISYHVVVDTSAFGPDPGFLGFQFNPGSLPGTTAAIATITNLAALGGTLADVVSTTGDASGGSSGPIVLRNTHSLNALRIGFHAGSTVSFDVTLTGPAISQPDHGTFGSTFSLQLLAADGITPRLTTATSGAILTIDLDSEGGTRATNFAASRDDARPLAGVVQSGSATVAAAALTATGRDITATAGAAFTGVVASFISGNPASPSDAFTATIDWGDGTPATAGTIAATGPGIFTIQGSHTFTRPDQFPLAVTIHGRGGSTATTGVIRFNAARTVKAGDGPVDMAIGDLDGDGRPDLVVLDASGTATDPGVAILLGRGLGEFQPAVLYAAGFGPDAVAIGDLNGDGRPDLAVADRGHYDVATNTTIGGSVSVLLGNGDGSFQAAVTIPAGSEPVALAIGDFDGDGRPDLAVANATSKDVSVLLGNGDGTFQAAKRVNNDGFSPASIAVGDLDGDGRLDIVTANPQGSLNVLLGNGDGTFRRPVSIDVGISPSSVAVADLDGDGKADVVVGDSVEDGVVDVLLGKGDGTFQPARYVAAGQSPYRVALGDLDGDGRLDLVATNAHAQLASAIDDPGGVSVLLGNGNGSFQPAIRFSPGGASAVVIGDVTGDGRPDLVVANEGVTVLAGRGDGTFHEAEETATSWTTQALASGDFDGDGKLDLAVASQPLGAGSSADDGVVKILLGNGDLTFGPARLLSAGPRPAALATGDFDGDGKLDLAVADTGATLDDRFGGVNLLLGNGDGTFRPGIFSRAGARPVSLVVGDLNGDGKLDLAVADEAGDDVSVLLGNGDGTFHAATHFAAGSLPESVAIGDFDGDGLPDLAVANFGASARIPFQSATSSVSVLLGAGDGTFRPATSYATAFGTRFVAVGDLNGDGRPDLVTANEGDLNPTGTGLGDGSRSVLLGNGDGTFRPGAVDGGNASPESVVLGDFNGDGRLDVAEAVFLGGSVNVQLGNGDGTFGITLARDLSNPHGGLNGGVPRSLIMGDFDGDGRPDLVAGSFLNFSSQEPVLGGNGDGTFDLPIIQQDSGGPFWIATGDLNGDGIPDLVTGNLGTASVGHDSSFPTISVLIGQGDATFRLAITVPIKRSGAAIPITLLDGLVVGDFNGDGTLDVATATAGGRSQSVMSDYNVAMLLGNGDGTFQDPVFTPIEGRARAQTAADLDGDGRLDLIITNFSTENPYQPLNDFSILFGRGDGTFRPPVHEPMIAPGVPTFARMTVSGDLNGDGKLDIAVLDRVDGLIGLFLNQGGGTFLPTTAVKPGLLLDVEAIGDFNSDGKLDLALASGATLNILLGKGDATFLPPLVFATRPSPNAIVVADFDGDGRLDLAVAHGSHEAFDGISLLLGNGDGTFRPAIEYAAGIDPAAAVAADLNGDGRTDLAVANEVVGTVGVYLGTSSAQVATVAAAPLSASGVPIATTASIPFSGVVARFRGENPLAVPGDFSATITWGDGQASAGSVVTDPDGGFDVVGTNTYTVAGSYPVQVAIQAGGSDPVTATSTAVVTAAGGETAMLTATGTALELTADQDSGDATIARFSDNQATPPAGGYTVTIDWGDGSPATSGVVIGAGAASLVTGRHTYPLAGTYTATITIADSAGRRAVATSTALVVGTTPIEQGPSMPSKPVVGPGPGVTPTTPDGGGSPTPTLTTPDGGGNPTPTAMPTPTPTPTATRDDGPVLLSLQRYGFHMRLTRLVLVFSAPLDPAGAQDPTNYHIAAPGPDGKLGTRDDQPTRVDSAVYDPQASTVTLSPHRRLNVHDRFRVTVNGSGPRGVHDLTGRLLDGDRDGWPGGSAVVPLDWRNLVLGNPHQSKPVSRGLARQLESARANSPVASAPGRNDSSHMDVAVVDAILSSWARSAEFWVPGHTHRHRWAQVPANCPSGDT